MESWWQFVWSGKNWQIVLHCWLIASSLCTCFVRCMKINILLRRERKCAHVPFHFSGYMDRLLENCLLKLLRMFAKFSLLWSWILLLLHLLRRQGTDLMFLLKLTWFPMVLLDGKWYHTLMVAQNLVADQDFLNAYARQVSWFLRSKNQFH